MKFGVSVVGTLGAEGEEMTPLFRRPQIAVVLGLLTAVFLVPPLRVHAEAEDADLELSRKQWREHAREIKRRVQEEAAQRRLEWHRARVEPSPEDEARRLSEIVLSDDSLVRGDLVMTDKGMLRFKGRSNEEEISASDFEPVENPGLKTKK